MGFIRFIQGWVVGTLILLAGGPLEVFGQVVGEEGADRRLEHAQGQRASLQLLRDGTSAASDGFDVTFYDLSIDIDFERLRIDGRTRVLGRATTQSMNILHLDLSSALEVTGVDDGAGTQLQFTHAEDVLAISLGREVQKGEQVDVYIDYGGTPRASGFGSFTFDQIDSGPIAWTLSEPWGAREWWPSRDHPSDKADSVRLVVTVPEGLLVASNGLLKDQRTHLGRITFEWVHRYPIATYLISIAAGPYVVYEDSYTRPDSLVQRYGPLTLPLPHYVYSRPGGSRLYSNWAEVKDMLAVYEHWFGPYPFSSEKYGHAEFTWRGGMEHQTMSSMGGSSIRLVSHEVVHQWYGNKITLENWQHLWLNEGFAAYGELLYLDEMSDRYPGQFEFELDVDMQGARGTDGPLVVQDTTDIDRLFNPNLVYAKGSTVLHMLRRMVGDEVFRAILQTYTADPDVIYGTATTSDFKRIAENVSSLDLSAFFYQWITDVFGYPEYGVSWRHDEEDDRVIYVVIGQIQSLPGSNIEVFEMPITMAVDTPSGHERHRIFNSQRREEFRLELQDVPVEVHFDPDGDLLRDPDVEVVRASSSHVLAAQIQSLYPNPASDWITIRYSTGVSNGAKLMIYDLLGRRIMTAEAMNTGEAIGELELNLEEYAPGVYFLNMSFENEVHRRSFVVAP